MRPWVGCIAVVLFTLCVQAQNLNRAEVVAFLPEDGPFRFTQDGKRLMTLYRINEGGRQTVQMFRILGNDLYLEDYLQLKPQNYLIGVDPEGKRIAVSGQSQCNMNEPWPSTRFSSDSLGRLDVLSFPKGRLLLRLEDQSLCGLTYPVFSPNGKLLAVPNINGYVQFWDGESGQLKHTFKGTGRIETIAFSPNGRKLAICEKGVAIYEVSTRKLLQHLKDTRCAVIYPVFTLDGSRLVVADGKNPVGIWNLSTGKLERSLPQRDGQAANALAINLDGTRIVTLDVGRGLSVYDFQSGKVLYQTDKGGAALIASPSLQWFATVAPPQLWRLR